DGDPIAFPVFIVFGSNRGPKGGSFLQISEGGDEYDFIVDDVLEGLCNHRIVVQNILERAKVTAVAVVNNGCASLNCMINRSGQIQPIRSKIHVTVLHHRNRDHYGFISNAMHTDVIFGCSNETSHRGPMY